MEQLQWMEQLQFLLLASFLSLLLLNCSHDSSAAAACFEPDRAALRQLASAFLQNSAPHWLSSKPKHSTTAFVGWEGDECCSWHGVVCKSQRAAASNARVSKILLSSKNLVGTIPLAVCSLSALSTLDLSHNFLTGFIPMCLGQNLTNLRHLDLSHNVLNGTIPTSFSGLLQLRSLNLGWNFDGVFRLEVCLWGSMLPVSELGHLTYLDLSNSCFNSIPPFKTPRLQSLLLSGMISYNIEIIPVFTNGTPNLQYLDLSWNTFSSGTSNLSTFPLPHLHRLDLSDCTYLSGDIPVTAFISHLPHLRTLLLKDTNLAAQGRQISDLLCGLKSLERFSAAGSDWLRSHLISGDLPAVLPSTCKSPSVNLTFLDLSQNQLSGPFPAWMSLFSKLRVLDLSGNNLYASSIPPEWQNLTRLTVLGLSGLASTTPPSTTTPPFRLPQHMQNWLFRLPLQTLTLSSLGLTNQHIPCSQLSLLNATLQSLDFSHNLLSDSHALQCLAHNNFTALASLDLSHNALAFKLGLAIPPSLSGNLNLSSCQLEGELTDQFFGILGSSMRWPGSVSLAHNYFSGNLPVRIGGLPYLDSLDLSYNDFTGPLPPSLGNLTFLEVLHLENNHLEGQIPEELANMSNVESVFLGHNQLTKCLYTRSSSNYLEILDLSYNRLEGDLVQTFFGHDSLTKNLVVLLLGQNRLTGAMPVQALNGTTALLQLSVIQLSGNRLTGTIPHTLFTMFPSLTVPGYHSPPDLTEREFTLVVKSLQLSYDYRDDENIFAYLDLSNNRLNGWIPESLGDLSRLRHLNLSKNQLTGTIPSSLANLSLLESLDLSYNRLQGPIPTSLSQLTTLEVFNVSFNDGLSGPIPNSPQFEQSTSYIGDPKLCGEPVILQQTCSGAAPQPLHEVEDKETDSSDSFLLKWIDEWIAIPGLCLGLVVGFSGALWVLRLTRFV